MLRSLKQLLTLLSRKERLQLIGVLGAMLAMGLAQMAGVGVVLPFVQLLSNPANVQNSSALHWLYIALNFQSTKDFLLFIGGGLLVVLIASNIITASTIWLMTRFSWRVQARISTRLLSGYLHQPYEALLNRNTAGHSKNILVETRQLANNVMIPMLRAMAFGITALIIVGFLFWLKPLLALIVAIVFGGAYLLVYLTIRRVLLRAGSRRVNANTDRFQAVNEAFGSVKEVKVMGRELHFIGRYTPAAGRFADAEALDRALGEVPRYAIEGLAFGIVMAAMLALLASGQDLQSALPVASAFVVAGYRLLPALQNIYQGLTKVRFNKATLDTLVDDVNDQPAFDDPPETANGTTTGERSKLPFQDRIELENLTYHYPQANNPSLDNVSLTIRCNSFVALTGSTGAGKTTLADVILGLLKPDGGQIRIDDVPLTEDNRAHWQANLGYVPQDIYLTDSTVTSNIAYGIADHEIDPEAVERAARIANIHDFITEELSSGYDTIVGERGVRLSGGQRQRIGIARALYHDPDVIVLDEATSALDNETERHIVNELDAMRGGRTLIVIAHRLTTVQKCHEVFMLHDGRLAARGSYDELIQESAEFGQLAKADRNKQGKNRAEEQKV